MSKSIKKTKYARTPKTTHYVRRIHMGDGTIQFEDLKVTTNGSFYAEEGKAWRQVIVDVGEYKKPDVTINTDPSTTLYDISVDKLRELMISLNVKRNTNDISKVELYVDNVMVKSVTEDIAKGGIITYNAEFNPARNTNINIKATVYDSANKTNTVSRDIKFVGKNYYGTVGADVETLTPDEIKALSSTLVGVKSYVYSGINMDYGKVVYAYPSAFGSLSFIRDTKNNIDYTASFTKKLVTIDAISYNLYILTDAVAAEDVQVTFA